MYINLLIILFNVNLPLFALQLFDCEISYFWNPFYFILQNKYIILVYLLCYFNHFFYYSSLFSLLFSFLSECHFFCWFRIASKK